VLKELSKVEQRYLAVLAVQVDGLTVTEVAQKWGVSRQTVHTWLRRYEEAGVEGLAERSHRPATCPHQMPAVLEARVCELRRHHPLWGPVRLRYQLARDGVAELPSTMGIWRALVRHGLIEPGARRRRLPTYRRWERGRPMELWQLDVVGGVLLADGAEAKVLTGLDDHSRFCVAAGLMAKAVARAVCGHFAVALSTHGVPEEVLTDNGKVFTGRFSTRPAPAAPSLDPHLEALAAARSGSEWITRHVATNGVVTVAYQQLSVGRHREGRTVDVRVLPELLEVWDGNELIRTIARTSKGTIRKKRAATR
jgi:transposase